MVVEGTYLGFDFGLKRIGVAVGQSITRTASPLKTLAAHKGVPDWQVVAKLISEWRPQGLVIGLPLNMDGTPQAITQFATAFAEQLKQFNLLIYTSDERLTTKEARQQLFAQGGYKALENAQIDSMAAKLILESWLSQHFFG